MSAKIFKAIVLAVPILLAAPVSTNARASPGEQVALSGHGAS